jgi:hypothetical protein
LKPRLVKEWLASCLLFLIITIAIAFTLILTFLVWNEAFACLLRWFPSLWDGPCVLVAAA